MPDIQLTIDQVLALKKKIPETQYAKLLITISATPFFNDVEFTVFYRIAAAESGIQLNQIYKSKQITLDHLNRIIDKFKTKKLIIETVENPTTRIFSLSHTVFRPNKKAASDTSTDQTTIMEWIDPTEINWQLDKEVTLRTHEAPGYQYFLSELFHQDFLNSFSEESSSFPQQQNEIQENINTTHHQTTINNLYDEVEYLKKYLIHFLQVMIEKNIKQQWEAYDQLFENYHIIDFIPSQQKNIPNYKEKIHNQFLLEFKNRFQKVKETYINSPKENYIKTTYQQIEITIQEFLNKMMNEFQAVSELLKSISYLSNRAKQQSQMNTKRKLENISSVSLFAKDKINKLNTDVVNKYKKSKKI